MGVSSGRSRIADLTFQVFRRPLHPDWFTTRAFRRVEHRGWGADLRIIEGGHAVLFRSGSVCLSEILSGPETVLPEPGLLLPLPPPPRADRPPAPGGPDRIPELRRRRAGRPRDLPAPLRGDDPRRGARRPLPPLPIGQPPGPAADQPSPHQRPGQHAWRSTSFHTFPDECAIVRTQSLFELKPSLIQALNDGRRPAAIVPASAAAVAAAIRRVVAVPTVGRSLRGAAADSPRRCWESASRHVDKTSVGPSRPGPPAGPSPPGRPVRVRPIPPVAVRSPRAEILLVFIWISKERDRPRSAGTRPGKNDEGLKKIMRGRRRS